MTSETKPISVHNEWDPIEEIIVGDVSYAAHPIEDRGYEVLNSDVIEKGPGTYAHQFPEHVIEETREDLEKLCEDLTKAGVRVRRPRPARQSRRIATPDWEADQFFCYCPRDVLLPIGDQIIETPGVFRSRYFEVHAYSQMLHEYLRAGSRWISAPRPRLLDDLFDETAEFDKRLRNLEVAFDAANCLRAGRDIFYLVSDSGNEWGRLWLQSALGDEYRVHACPNLNCSIHIDSTITLLRPGLVLVNPARVDATNLPSPLEQWEVMWAPTMEEYVYSDCRPVSSAWLGMNLLMINPNLAMVDVHQRELIAMLERRKIDVIPTLLRHGRTLGGGVHCVTLDVRRTGVLEDYFDVRG